MADKPNLVINWLKSALIGARVGGIVLRRRLVSGSLAIALVSIAGAVAHADSMISALTQAYVNNPQLNAQRASVRATDEAVPQALSGYRPRVSLSASVSSQYLDTLGKSVFNNGAASYQDNHGWAAVQTYGGTLTQPVFNGFGTASRTRQAEQLVSAARQTLRLTEQTVLLAAATAYMNLLRDIAILELQRRNVEVLLEQLSQTKERYAAGEVTSTDVSQSELRLRAGRNAALTAESNYATSRATYRQVIGVEPGSLTPASPVDRLFPRTLPPAVAEARGNHPAVTTAMFNVDAAVLQVKIAESSLYPTVNIIANAQQQYGNPTALNVLRQFSASAGGQLAIPLYQGGTEYSTIRQAKETLSQRRVDLDTARDQAQQALLQAWGQLDAAKSQITESEGQVKAAESALNGVREEAKVGQRTTLDVLNAQQELVNARITLVTAQRDRVVASYTVLAGVGRLSAQVLRLNVPIYDPAVHYHQVRDTWVGVRTPDGK